MTREPLSGSTPAAIPYLESLPESAGEFRHDFWHDIALGELEGIAQARQLIASMGVTRTYQPNPSAAWADMQGRLKIG